ncbi:phage lysis regulatory protein/holin [uncultured phage cr44_1]|uniref:Phage lysis regulatory protein/holin n=1 Tax=uncultured phage cr44_1 TaxID=2986405 RepID=A0AAE7RUX4_9CAUD|nr:phage lysis regulatory protein/holin [uncultured phage cr44_1]QWM89869.1 phage lysis regulatory protein/holin [uncultured phage cr44_1]
MIDLGILITGGVGIITTVISGWTSWFFARRKYNSEVDNNLIENMQQSLEFYKKLSDDNKNRLDEVLKRNAGLEQEIRDLRKQMFSLMNSICTDLTCQLRKRNLNLFNEQNGTDSRQEMEETELHDK